MEDKQNSKPQLLAGYGEMLLITDLQKIFGISKRTALEVAKSPEIHGVKVGNKYYILKANVLKFLLAEQPAS